MGLSLTVLGSCGGYAAAGRACSGYLVRCDGTAVWLDAGSGSLANLQRHMSPDLIDAIVLTHEHPDHWTDVTGFHVAAKYVYGMRDVRVIAPASVRDAVYNPGPPLRWEIVSSGDKVTVGALGLTFSRTDHPVETLAVRVDGGGRSLGYSADTGPGWSLDALGDDLDLALCEASYLHDQEGQGHMSARQAGITARQAKARRLVLTHVRPGIDHEAIRSEGQAAFGGPVEVATEHMEFQL
ncbi:MAG: MBL fold metallo-hydrolase [Acidimicrobiales bacterium]